MATSVGPAMNPPHAEERAVFTQLKPVRMSAADSAEDTSVFEDIKPPLLAWRGPPPTHTHTHTSCLPSRN
uniref:Uncharacterized protein n=1 Tax=Takifugu rubripes TaxID=31033 RepID=A0A674P7S0_TAKRU